MTAQTSTPRFRPVIRVFVSSTFSDLKAARNALQERPFSWLKRYCQHWGTHRMQNHKCGVRNGRRWRTQAALSHSTMRICLSGIAHCQAVTPHASFAVLLADRHGWRPLPDGIAALIHLIQPPPPGN